MSLITCCPSCATLFKVVPDQLRISKGWVRCGHCSEMFDAAAYMLQTNVTPPPAPLPPASPAPAHAASPAFAAAPMVPDTAEPAVSWQMPITPVTHEAALDDLAEHASAQSSSDAWPYDVTAAPNISTSDASTAPAPGVAAARAPWTPRDRPAPGAEVEVPLPNDTVAPLQVLTNGPAPVVSAPADAAASDITSAVPGAEAAASTPAEMGFLPSGVDADALTEDSAVPPAAWAAEVEAEPLPTPSFVTQAHRRAFWASRPVRALLWLLALLLALGLAGQAALDQRDWLAAREPRLTPVLQALCQPLDCRVAPYRQRAALLIDSSAVYRVPSGGFRLAFTLRNTADLPVASPALELTLTDPLGQPLLRRVLLPAELNAPPIIAAHGDWSGGSTFNIAAGANPATVTEHRLVAFYP